MLSSADTSTFERPSEALRDAAIDPLSPDVEFDPTYFQHERYLQGAGRSPALTAYYALKPLIPRPVQLAARRVYAHRQRRRDFPRWPIEPVLVARMHEQLAGELRRSGAGRLAVRGWWPAPYLCACVLTHDVEGAAGLERIDEIVAIERKHGLRSSWNFVAEDYEIPAGTFDRLRDAGCEIGLHGIRHDGKLFQSRRSFLRELPKIRCYMDRWQAVGFRSPATHRRAEWMEGLGCLYDSSYPDTDPFEPQPGGCCSILPFMFGDVVELPITMVQDHTLWEVLGERTIELWLSKSDWIAAHHGLININTHPDYLVTPERLRAYDEFVASVASIDRCWHALPNAVAGWWRQRQKPGGADVTWWARLDGDGIVLES
ncbi:MAG: polysaccharide deacetylase family protein [Solirubrobacteraceae bacterium]